MIKGPSRRTIEEPGTKLYAARNNVGIFESLTSYEYLRFVNEGEVVEAAGEPVDIEGFQTVPILPKGAVVLGEFSTSNIPVSIPSPGEWPNRTWPDGVGDKPNWFAIDSSLQAFRLLLDTPMGIRTSDDCPPSAVDQANATKKDMATWILATVQTGGWVTGWCCSLIQLIASSIQECCWLTLVCVKGGKACDEEWYLIIHVLKEFGFQPVFSMDPLFTPTCTRPSYSFYWLKDRGSSIAPLLVEVSLSRAAEDARIEMAMAPQEQHGLAPNLKRVALVSSPEGAISSLNQLLNSQMDRAISRADAKGFSPSAHYLSSEAACSAWRDYLGGANPVPLSDSGLEPVDLFQRPQA